MRFGRGAAHQQLRRLPVKRARTDSLAEDTLNAKDLRLRQTPLVVATLAFPPGTPLTSDLAQVLVAQVARARSVAVLPDACSLAWRDRGAGTSRGECRLTVSTIICSVSRDLAKRLAGLRQQVGQELRVFERVGRDRDRDELHRRRVHVEVESRATFGGARLRAVLLSIRLRHRL